MQGDLERTFAHPHRLGRLGLRGPLRRRGKERFELLEQFTLPAGDLLRTQSLEDPVEQRERPLPLVQPLRRPCVGRLELKAGIALAEID